MDIPAPIRAFLEALPAKTPFRLELDGWRIEIKATDLSGLRFSTPENESPLTLTGLAGWLPDKQSMPRDPGIEAAIASTAAELGIAADELARARRRTSDIASLARPVPEFEDDPMGAEAAAEGPGLSDKARADFAAATAPPAEQS